MGVGAARAFLGEAFPQEEEKVAIPGGEGSNTLQAFQGREQATPRDQCGGV